MVEAFEALIGALLLSGRFAPLSLVMLVPIPVGSVLDHAMLDAGGGVPACLVAVRTLLWTYREPLPPLLHPVTRPATASREPRLATT